MLKSLKALQELQISAINGKLGTIYDFYFDDQNWHIRYFVIETGSWLSDQKVIISAESVAQPDWDKHNLPVELTLKEIEYSPEIGAIKPVSEQQLYDSPLPPVSRLGGGLLSEQVIGMRADSIVETIRSKERQKENAANGDSPNYHLRSVREVRNYNIQARDGEIGYINDFIVQDETWALQYLVVDTRKWLPGRTVLVSPAWVEMVDWNESKVLVNLSQQAIKDSPAYDPARPLERDYENELYDHYQAQKYWS